MLTTVITADISDLEERVVAQGQRLLSLAEKHIESDRKNNPWLDRFLDRIMEDEMFRVQALRFVDVIPQLDDDQDLIRHFDEYFSEHDLPLTGLIRFGLRYSKTGITRALLARTIRKVIRHLAMRFMGGATAAEACATARKLHEQDIGFSIDLLGESVVSEAEANNYLQKYHDLIEKLPHEITGWPVTDKIYAPKSQLNFSLKLSSLYSQINPLDPQYSIDGIASRLRPLLKAARASGACVFFDMEHYDYKAITIGCFKQLLMEDDFRDWSDVGLAMQAYLCETEADIRSLIRWVQERGTPVSVRLVRGAYWDQETIIAGQHGWVSPVWTEKRQTDACFERCLHLLFNHANLIRPAVATHNIRSIALAMVLAKQHKLSPADFEFQMLYGMSGAYRNIIPESGYALRIYLPFGDLLPGMAYLVRRLLENSASQSYQRLTNMQELPRREILASPHRPTQDESVPHNRTGSTKRTTRRFINQPMHRFTAVEERQNFSDALSKVRAGLGAEYPLIIGGKKITSGQSISSVNPACPSEVVGRVAMAGQQEAEQAIVAAKQASDQWAATNINQRAEYLHLTARLLHKQRDSFAALEVFEAGKTWREADANITEAIDFLEYYADEAIRLDQAGKISFPGEENTLCYRPRGVALIISPWNFPLAILTGMLSAALVTGNTAIVKPSSETPVIAAKMIALFHEAGLPEDVIQFVPGSGGEVGEYLVQHRDVHVIAFTGSREIGERILRLASQRSAGQSHFKHVVAEMGGKNAIIIDTDADLDEAVVGTFQSAFGYQGQKCSACSRVIVVGDHYEVFLDRLIAATASLTMGLPEEPATAIGPVISQNALQGIRQAIEKGKQSAQLVLDRSLHYTGDGYFTGPVIFNDVVPDSSLAQEEIFGPVLSVMKAEDLDTAIAIANHNEYALTGGIYSRSPANIQKLVSQLQAGNIYINRKITGALVGRQPFGGYKLSGTGSKAGGADYLKHFLTPVTVTENTLRRGFAPSENSN